MAQLYRKSVLDRLSSPEQLDKMIVITSPSLWIAMIGAALIVTVALVWSVFGELPVKQEASGILVPNQGAYTLAAETGGIVSTVEVKIGDHVKEGDVMVVLADADVQTELDALKERYEKVETVTLDSVGDIVTQDNRDLINLKTQIATSGVESEQQSAMLAMYQADLAEISPKVVEAEAAKEKAKGEYYNILGVTPDNSAELQFSEAQSAYNQSLSVYTSYSGNADTAKASYKNTLQSVLDNLKSTVKSAIAQLESMENAQTPDENMDETSEEETTPEEDLSQGEQQLLITIGTSQFAKEELKVILTDLNNTGKSTAPSDLKGTVVSIMNAADGSGSTYSQLQQLWVQYETASEVSAEAEEDYENASNDYQSAKQNYEEYAETSTSINVQKEKLGNVYNELNNEYSNLYSQEQQIKSQIASLEGQLRAAQISASVQTESYKQQFEATRGAILDNLQNEINKYEYNLEKTRIKSTVSGVVSDIKVNEGAALGQGSDVVTIRQLSEENLIVCYIPLNSGKKIEEGMTVIVKPTTVNDQEYGHMEAEVVEIDEYVATSASMRGILGDDTLVQTFTQNGPVVGVTCRLRTDDSTASGYWWSNKKGTDIMISEGTLVSADIVIEKKRPISMLIPLLKEKLTMAVEPEQNQGGNN